MLFHGNKNKKENLTMPIISKKDEKVHSLYFSQDSLLEFTSFVLDAYNSNQKSNPVITYLSEVSGFSYKEVSDAFKYYGYFDRWSKMPFSNILLEANIPRKHWWNLYHLYQRHDIKQSFKNMYDYCTLHLIE